MYNEMTQSEYLCSCVEDITSKQDWLPYFFSILRNSDVDSTVSRSMKINCHRSQVLPKTKESADVDSCQFPTLRGCSKIVKVRLKKQKYVCVYIYNDMLLLGA